MKNISKAYNACLTKRPRDEEFKRILNLGTLEAKIALKRLLKEKPFELTQAEKGLLEYLVLEGIPDKL